MGRYVSSWTLRAKIAAAHAPDLGPDLQVNNCYELSIKCNNFRALLELIRSCKTFRFQTLGEICAKIGRLERAQLRTFDNYSGREQKYNRFSSLRKWEVLKKSICPFLYSFAIDAWQAQYGSARMPNSSGVSCNYKNHIGNTLPLFAHPDKYQHSRSGRKPFYRHMGY